MENEIGASAEKVMYSQIELGGVVLDRVNEVKELIGEDVRGYLANTFKQGMSEEEVAEQLSEKAGYKINTYPVFVLKKVFHLRPIPLRVTGKAEMAKNSQLLFEAIEKKLIKVEDLGETEQILTYTQCLGSRMSLQRLSKDLSIPRVKLSKIAQGIIEHARQALSR